MAPPSEGMNVSAPVLVVDLGGTRMRAALVDHGGEVLERRTQPTPPDADCPTALLALIADVPAEGVESAVIGVPGRVDYEAGRLEHTPNLPPHWPVALSEADLAEHLGVGVRLANDADLAAVGEAWFGAGRGHDDVAYLTISTGVGAGVVLGRRLVHGRRSLAEVGHTVLDLTAAHAGRPATFETLASGTALDRMAARVGLPPDGASLVELVRDGDPQARQVWYELVGAAAVGLVNLAFSFSPSIIVVGGGVSRAGQLLVDPLRAYLRSHGPPGMAIEVVAASLGDDAGLVGGAAWRQATQPLPGSTGLT